MRIALLCPNLSSNALVRTYPIARVLERRHALQVLGFRSGPEVFEPYREELSYDTLPLGRMPRFLLQARELAQRVRADAVYVFKPLASSLWVGLLARRMHKIPLFLDVEDLESAWYYDVPFRDALLHLLHAERPNGFLWTWLTEKLLIQRSDETFVVSRSLQRRFGGTLLVHGADTSFFDPARISMEEARRTLGLTQGRYVVFTGTPLPQKGLGDLLEAVKRLKDPGLRVLVVGGFPHNPEYRDALLKDHASRLLMLGPRPHKEMPLFLAAADVVALPQRRTRTTEAQVPGKLFEAMAMARPILATGVSDLPEILDGCGRLLPAGASIEELADGLSWILQSRAAAKELGAAARRRCLERYSWDAMETILEDRIARWRVAS